jgi:hypothetical protein
LRRKRGPDNQRDAQPQMPSLYQAQKGPVVRRSSAINRIRGHLPERVLTIRVGRDLPKLHCRTDGKIRRAACPGRSLSYGPRFLPEAVSSQACAYPRAL